MVSKPKLLGTSRHSACNPNEKLRTLRTLDVGWLAIRPVTVTIPWASVENGSNVGAVRSVLPPLCLYQFREAVVPQDREKTCSMIRGAAYESCQLAATYGNTCSIYSNSCPFR